MKYDTLLFKCSNRILNIFMPELQKGFYIQSYEGKSIFSFLVEQCGLSSDYIDGKIKTVFIDGGPIDDIFNTKIKDEGVCALSGAMPGIVGAMMRMGSPYASMRESITVRPYQTSEAGKEIIYGVKLFNVVLSDTGISFLTRGILVEKERIMELLVRYGDKIKFECSEIMINGFIIDKPEGVLSVIDNMSSHIMLKIELEDENKS